MRVLRVLPVRPRDSRRFARLSSWSWWRCATSGAGCGLVRASWGADQGVIVTTADMQAELAAFFAMYEARFNAALRSEGPAGALTELYAEVFIAAHPDGVDGAMNDEGFVETLEEGFQYYRLIGARGMAVDGVEVTPLDDLHAMARVRWRAVYARPSDSAEVALRFDVVYLLQKQEVWRVFAYVSGDEQAAYREAELGVDID